jgi:hypothetical protein
MTTIVWVTNRPGHGWEEFLQANNNEEISVGLMWPPLMSAMVYSNTETPKPNANDVAIRNDAWVSVLSRMTLMNHDNEKKQQIRK